MRLRDAYVQAVESEATKPSTTSEQNSQVPPSPKAPNAKHSSMSVKVASANYNFLVAFSGFN
jgi:hypothetical protein